MVYLGVLHYCGNIPARDSSYQGDRVGNRVTVAYRPTSTNAKAVILVMFGGMFGVAWFVDKKRWFECHVWTAKAGRRHGDQ